MRTWQDVDPHARRARDRIREEVRSRYGVDVDAPRADPAALADAIAARDGAERDATRGRQESVRDETEAALLMDQADRVDREQNPGQATSDAGVSLRTARRWLSRYREAGVSGLGRRERADRGHHRLRGGLSHFQGSETATVSGDRPVTGTHHRAVHTRLLPSTQNADDAVTVGADVAGPLPRRQGWPTARRRPGRSSRPLRPRVRQRPHSALGWRYMGVTKVGAVLAPPLGGAR